MMTKKLQTKRNTGLNAICKTATALLFSVSMSAVFMACSHDDDLNEKSKSNKKEGTIAIKTHDNLAAFQNTIVETNEEGKVISYIYGEPLDESDPEHLYIGVDNIQEAKEMFGLWLTNDAILKPTKKGGVSVLLTSKEGIQQGTIFFNPGTEENHIAEVTASPETPLKGFRCITFLNNNAWPKSNLLTGARKWQRFDIVRNIHMKDISDCLSSNDQRLNFVCIQGSSNGVKPIFCAISNTKYRNPISNKYLNMMRKSRYCPGENSSPTAFNIQKILQPNWDSFVETFKEAGNGSLIQGCNYWYDETHYTFIFEYNGVICYRSGATYGEDDFDRTYNMLYRIYGKNDSDIYDGASL